MELWPNLREAVANSIIKLRADFDISKRKLAKLSYIDRVYISQLERSKYSLTLNALCYIASGFGMKASEFIKLVEDEMDLLKDKQRVDNE